METFCRKKCPAQERKFVDFLKSHSEILFFSGRNLHFYCPFLRIMFSILSAFSSAFYNLGCFVCVDWSGQNMWGDLHSIISAAREARKKRRSRLDSIVAKDKISVPGALKAILVSPAEETQNLHFHDISRNFSRTDLQAKMRPV